jgi:hypothetical protein
VTGEAGRSRLGAGAGGHGGGAVCVLRPGARGRI